MRIYSNDNVGIQSQLFGCLCIKIYNRFDYVVMYFTLSFVPMEVLNIKEVVIYCDRCIFSLGTCERGENR